MTIRSFNFMSPANSHGGNEFIRQTFHETNDTRMAGLCKACLLPAYDNERECSIVFIVDG